MHWRTAKGPTGASTVSMTPAMNALLVSLTPTKLAIFTVLSGVIGTGKYMLRRCHWHRRMHALPVSITPVRNFLPVSLTPVKLSKTVKVSLTSIVDTGKELFTSVIDTGEAPK